VSKTVPPTPDYVGAAQQTAQASASTTEAQTVANRPNVNTPWSSQSWNATPTWDPTTGTYVNQWTSNTNLVPQAQAALNSQLGVAQNQSATADTLTQQANQQLTKPIDWSNFQSLGATPQVQSYKNPNLQSSINTSGVTPVSTANTYANNAGNAAYQQYQNRNQPLQQQALTSMQSQLENQGLKPGDQAYDTAMRNLQNQQSDANTQASLGATQFGVQGGQIMQGEDLAQNQNAFNQAGTQATFANSAAQSALQDQLATGAQTFGQNLSAANYSDQVRQQQESEDLTQRGFTTNEINAMLTGQQVQTGPSPQFNAAGASQPTNYSGAIQGINNSAINAANVQNSATSNTVGAGIGILGALL
jgi:hypothetical protein